MFKNALTAIGAAARELLRNASALALFNLLYALLLAALYLFFSTREASVWQLSLTALLALVAPLLFFILQAACVGYAGAELRGLPLLRRALRDFWKLILVSLPFIALAVLVGYLVNRLQTRLPIPNGLEPVYTPRPPASAPPPPVRWQMFVFPALRLLLVGIVIPLLGVHFWIAVAREGFKATLRNFFRIIARAFSAQSIFVYTVGLVVFALMPYFLIYTRTGVSNGWLELAIFGLRLALAFVLTLWGWTITVGALTKLSLDNITTPRAETTNAVALNSDDAHAPATNAGAQA